MPNQPPRRPQGSSGKHINRGNAPTSQQSGRHLSAEQYAEQIRRQAAAKRKAQEKRRRMYMRRRIAFGALVIFILIGVVFGVKYAIESLTNKKPSSSQVQGNQSSSLNGSSNSGANSDPGSGAASEPSSGAASEPASSTPTAETDGSAFPVTTMVNANNPLPKGYVPETEKVNSTGHMFDTRAAAALKKMLSDGNETGLNLMVCSAYRSNARQTTLFNEMKDGYIAKGMTEQEAYDKTRTIRAIPGTSEHETALAADIVSVNYQTLDNGFEKTPEFKWLYENCAEYGFILRYPRDKTTITGTIYEPWHYRYVGVDMAKEIMSQSICLEEYVELKK